MGRKEKIAILTFIGVCFARSVFYMPEAQAGSAGNIQEVTASARAAILKGDVESAEKAAIEDALREAVEKVGVEVVSETVVENFELVKDRIVTRARGYVHGYDVLEKKRAGGYVYVKVKAKVSAEEIKKDADFIYEEMGKPRILIIVNEVTDGRSSPSRRAENIISEYFLKKNFKVVDSQVVREQVRRDEVRLAAEGNISAAKKLGARAGAEVIVTGTLNPGKPESIRGVLYASKSVVSLKSIRADTGELYGAATESVNGIDATPDGAVQKSVKEAAIKTAREIFWKTVKKWNEEKVTGRPIELIITGVRFSELGKLKKVLLSVDGIKEIHQRTYEKPSVVFDMLTEHSSQRVAELLTSRKREGFKFEVLSLSPGKIHLRMRK